MKSCHHKNPLSTLLGFVAGRYGRKFMLYSMLGASTLCSAAIQSQMLGTLFTTPEERAYLDYLRQDFLERSQQAGFDIDEATVSTALISEPEVISIIFHLGGIVNNSDGGRTIWLNDAALAEKDLPSNLSLVSRDGTTALKIYAREKNFYLKTGQTLDIESGQFWESFETIESEPSASDYLQDIGSSIQSSVEKVIDLPAPQPVSEEPDELISIQNLIESLQQMQNSKNAR